jgi:hypothetical protein
MTTRVGIAALVALALVAAACGDDSGDASDTSAPGTTATTSAPATTAAEAPTTTAAEAPTTTAAEAPTTQAEAPTTTAAEDMTDDVMCGDVSLQVEVSGLPELAGDVHYEGWGIVDGAPISTGKFIVGGGRALHLDGTPVECFTADGLETASTLVITIEPAGDADTIPSDTHIVAGDVTDGAAMLTISHPAALGTDFSDATGSFLLGTPTDGDGTNELSGIWFLELPGPTVSLDLPTLPAGWLYEGWTLIDGVPVTSGTFLTADGPDAFDGYSGDQDGPPFPGEDYLLNAPDGVTFPTDLSGATVVISVEPSPDDSTAPFALKPLLGVADDPAGDHVSYQLGNNAVDLPFAEATIG